MIEVKNLTKKYGLNTAVKDLSFTIEKGGICGFLGPNGAGKSTTMNIITGCLAANEGSVTIGGYDITDEPLKAKKLIGYLPENPPLYNDMSVKEYLTFVARAKKIPKSDIPSAIEYVMNRTSIFDVKDRLSANLSKGYRQRVGIAQAMLGDPEVIILDEPTVGLDPKQIIEIRELISELGKNHTVILSSHILSEIQEVCDRAVIIANGRVVAVDSMDTLRGMGNNNPVLHIIAKTEPSVAMDIVDTFEEVSHYAITECNDGTDMELTLFGDCDIREKLYFAFSNAGIALLEISMKVQSFEEIYLKLTELTPDDEYIEEEVQENDENTDEGEEYIPVFGKEDNDDSDI